MDRISSLLLIFIGFVLLICAEPARADDFCSNPSAELVEELAGSWRVSHGTGAAFAAGMTIPYRSPRDATIAFEYLPAFGIIRATGIDQVGEMIIFPSPPTIQGMASSTIAESMGNVPDGGCSSGSGPVLVGTSHYPNWEQVGSDFGPTACQTMFSTMTILALFGGLREELGPVVNYMHDNNTCNRSVENTLQSGGMTMKMVARFSDANQGAGYLTFEGRADGHSFTAYTPVTLSRN